MQTDAEIVQAVLNGDSAQFRLLFDRYERTVLGVAWGIVRDAESARDVAQDAFVDAYQRLASLNEHSVFGSWLVRITWNRAISALRRNSSVPTTFPINPDVAAAQNGNPEQNDEELMAAVLRLPDEERLAVTMRFFDGLSVRSISEATGRPVGTVTKRLSRAYQRLRQWLSEVDK